MATENENGALAVETRTKMLPRHEKTKNRRQNEARRDYGRGTAIDTRHIKDKKLRASLKRREVKNEDAMSKAKDAEILLENTSGFLEPEGELERTFKVRQDDIVDNVSVAAAQKRFELKLDQMGPYTCDYTRNGKGLLLGGRKGHVAAMDWRTGQLWTELQLGETIRDVRWLHNEQFFAVAQKKYVFVYDKQGVEIHRMKNLMEVTHMGFLPYHFLLGTIVSLLRFLMNGTDSQGTAGILKYTDTTHGQIVAEIPTRLGQPVSMAQNPYNAILNVGHQNGTVTMWSPNLQEPLVKLLAHRGPVRSLAMDREGRYMVSAGQDQKMAVWDIRMFKEVNSYHIGQPASSIAISDTGLTAVGWGTHTTIWKDLFKKNAPVQEKVRQPYMKWGGEGRRAERVQWCPYEDSLGIGHDKGFSSIIIPGAGEANFDALEVNPFETTKQRQEGEVKLLLNKLQPDTIALDPNFVGNLDLRTQKQKRTDQLPEGTSDDMEEVMRKRARGKNGAMKKYLRKQMKRNVIDDKRLKAEEMFKKQQDKTETRRDEAKEDLGPALSRFVR